MLLAANASVDKELIAADGATVSPLFQASQNEHEKVVKLLLASNASVNIGKIQIINGNKVYTKPYRCTSKGIKDIIKKHVGKQLEQEEAKECGVCMDELEGKAHFLGCCNSFIHVCCRDGVQAGTNQCPYCRHELELETVYEFPKRTIANPISDIIKKPERAFYI